MEAMKEFPDKYFDLAIVDPVYGDVTQGGYMRNLDSTTKLARPIHYHLGLWNQEKTGKEYFDELFRVSKNQIIWGGNYFTVEIGKDTQCWIVWDKERTGGFAEFEIAWTSFNKASRIFRYMWNGMLQGDMKNKERRIHPTQKPVALYKWLLDKYAKKGDKILDTHAGSASSLVACHICGFAGWGFEIDETYYQEAKERLQEAKNQINIFELM
ncbi:MAG: site-specific DNA-methyltransferase [Treponema sp.]|nr:site-specific DNA-methyltransferase [Treponema sp.]